LAISVRDRWNYYGIEEHQGCCDDQEGAFHGYFLLVFENRTVIFS
jgi:hypothetical protein